MKQLMAACVLSCAFLTGCAAKVDTSGSQDLRIAEPVKHELALAFKGNSKVEANEDWERLRQTWTNSMNSEAAAAGYSIQPATASGSGLLVQVNVSNFRYLTPGSRMAVGIMSGNAWVNSSVDFIDQASGKNLGTRNYNTTSSAWEGVASAMTYKQVQAISKQIIADIKAAKAQ